MQTTKDLTDFISRTENFSNIIETDLQSNQVVTKEIISPEESTQTGSPSES